MHGSLRLGTRHRRFLREEDGSITIFTLLILVFMLVVAGMAIDMMRHETARARLQSVTDRAILAAADLSQVYSEDWTAEDVVRDYFEKAGLLDQLESVKVNETVNSRTVSAEASLGIGTYFMQLAGVDSLTAAAAGTAEESVSDIEIVLVLDVSYSMIYNIESGQPSQRLANLKTAAKNFISTVLENDREQRISITIVPFNGQVNLGPTLFDKFNDTFNVTDQHGTANSYCIDLPTTAFGQAAIPTTMALPQAGHFDSWGDTRTRNANWLAPQAMGSTSNTPFGGVTPYLVPVCRLATGNFVTLPPVPGGTLDAGQTDPRVSPLHTAIDNLAAGGFTSIYLGMKWGLMMLDPSMRPVYTAMGRPDTWPYDYDRENTLKIIVLMTDGEHQASHYLNAGYRSGNSPIWRRGTTNEYSILHSGRATSTTASIRCRPFFVPHLTGTDANNWATYRWQPRQWNGTTVTSSTPCYNGTPGTVTGASRLTWPTVWSTLQMNWVAYQLHARANCLSGLTGMTDNQTCRDREYLSSLIAIRGPSSGSDTLDSGNELTEFSLSMDTQLQQTCDQAKRVDTGITVYGIAFEAPERGQDLIEYCASSDSHYFYTTTSEIDSTFNTIAANIIALRLTQ